MAFHSASSSSSSSVCDSNQLQRANRHFQRALETVTEEPFRLKQLQEGYASTSLTTHLPYLPVSSSSLPTALPSFARPLPPRSSAFEEQHVFEEAWQDASHAPFAKPWSFNRPLSISPSPQLESALEQQLEGRLQRLIGTSNDVTAAAEEDTSNWHLEFSRAGLNVDFLKAQESSEFTDGAFDESKRMLDGGANAFDKDMARQLIGELRQVGDPKLSASEFLKFVEKFADGDVQFQNNKLVDAKGSEVDWNQLYAAERRQNGADIDAVDSQARSLAEAWKTTNAGEITEAERELFAATFREAELQKAFASAWSDEEQEPIGVSLDKTWASEFEDNNSTFHYSFVSENPYLNSAVSPLVEGNRLAEEGHYSEAVLAYEAEVQTYPDSSEGWRLLGQLLADREQDVQAIACLKRGHQVDPYNLDSLLALGVSLANELDAPQALRHLLTWLTNHDEYQSLLSHSKPLPLEDFSSLKELVRNLFVRAAQLAPHDVHVQTALGVIYNIERNYPQAVLHLVNALKCSPSALRASLWNKLGATLANSGKSETALAAYHEALSLKPNYPRTWANLAIAYANIDQPLEAVRFYLSALSLNPKAAHLWQYVHNALTNCGKYELLELATNRNLAALREFFPGVIDELQLPEPAAPTPNEDQILHSCLEAV